MPANVCGQLTGDGYAGHLCTTVLLCIQCGVVACGDAVWREARCLGVQCFFYLLDLAVTVLISFYSQSMVHIFTEHSLLISEHMYGDVEHTSPHTYQGGRFV